MSRKTLWIVAALAALLMQGCATGAQVRVDFDPKTDFQALRSYAWAPMTAEEQQQKSRNSLTHERIQSAVDAHLAARGYAKVAEAQADFLVTHTVTVESRTQVQSTQMSVGYGRYGAHGGVGVGYGIPVEYHGLSIQGRNADHRCHRRQAKTPRLARLRRANPGRGSDARKAH